LRDILTYGHNLRDVQTIIKESPGDCSFVYLMSDGKSKESEMYVRDRDRFLVFKTGDAFEEKNEKLEPIEDTLYGGHFLDRMKELLNTWHGKITPQLLMNEIIPKLGMKQANFQNVIYDPVHLKFWVSNAKGPDVPAMGQPYLEFDFGGELKKFREHQ